MGLSSEARPGYSQERALRCITSTCDLEAIHRAYFYCSSLGLLERLEFVVISLLFRRCYVNIDSIVYILFLSAYCDENIDLYVPDFVINELEVKPIVTDTKKKPCVYWYVRIHSWMYVNNVPDDKIGKWPKIVPTREVFESFPLSDWEGLFEYCFPPRCKGDLGIRNLRLLDIYYLYLGLEDEDLFWTRLSQMAGKSYIFVMNIMLYAAIVTSQWYDILSDSGAWTLDEYSLRDLFRQLSDDLKKKDFWQTRDAVSVFIENHNLFGALLPPVEGWDPVSQTRALASCDPEPHGLLYGPPEYKPDVYFNQIADLELFRGPKARTGPRLGIVDLQSFIMIGDWERSGASSIGRIPWSYIDQEDPEYNKSGVFKARKNLVLDVMEASELAEECLSKREHVKNTAIIKSELAKIRIAVASPLEVYLLESYVMEWANHYYLGWVGSTLEESSVVEFHRMFAQWTKMRDGHYVLPYDFEHFDHQVSQAELLKILEVGHEIAQLHFGGTNIDELNHAIKIINSSVKHAVLHDPPGFGNQEYPVNNGLLSGMRSTSTVGNAFNLVVFRMADKVFELITGRSAGFDRVEIRGDDLRVTHKNQFRLILLYYIYKSLGLEANPSKFGLCHRRGDFLRLDCDHESGIVGLPARTLPSVTQRKPWKSAQWIGEGRLTNVCENFFNVIRRLPVLWQKSERILKLCKVFIETITTNWSRFMKIDPCYVSIPKAAGGLGLADWDGCTFIGKKGNKVPVNFFENVSINLEIGGSPTESRKAKIRDNYKYDGIPLEEHELAKLVHEDHLQKVASDDIPDMIKIIRYHYRKFLRGLRFRHLSVKRVKKEDLNLEVVLPYEEDLAKLPAIEDGLKLLEQIGRNDNGYTFGTFSHLTSKIRKLLTVGRMRGWPVKKSLAEIGEFMAHCKKLEKRLKMKRHVAIEWLTEGLTIDHSHELHPSTIGYLSQIAGNVIGKLVGRIADNDSFTILWSKISRRLIESVKKSPLYQLFFSY